MLIATGDDPGASVTDKEELGERLYVLIKDYCVSAFLFHTHTPTHPHTHTHTHIHTLTWAHARQRSKKKNNA